MPEAICDAGHPYVTGNGCGDCRLDKREVWRATWRAKQPPRDVPTRHSVRGRPEVEQQDAWRADAACSPTATALDPNEWFLPKEANALRAKAVCEACPVQAACLDYALRTRQPWGVWGGKTSKERGTAY